MYLILKNLTDFRKTVETGVDPRLIMVKFHNYHTQRLKATFMKDSNSSQQFVFVKSNENKNKRNFRTQQQTQENDSFGNQSESRGG